MLYTISRLKHNFDPQIRLMNTQKMGLRARLGMQKLGGEAEGRSLDLHLGSTSNIHLFSLETPGVLPQLT